MAITILEGSNFCISDENGDFTFTTSGLYAFDTRFLSRLELTINGARPLLLSAGKAEYYSAAYFLRNPPAEGLRQDSVSIARHRFVGEGMQDRITVQNQTRKPVSLELALEFGNDFADIFAVKNYDFALGDPDKARALPPEVEARLRGEREPVRARRRRRPRAHPDHPHAARARRARTGCATGSSSSRARRGSSASTSCRRSTGASCGPHVAQQRFGEERDRIEASLAAWNLRVPRLRASWDDLDHVFPRSVADLASLRLQGAGGFGNLPAAGMPWFMTVFGRDTIITCLQTLLFGPELAWSALEVLADLQAVEDDPSIDAEPGKIVHELRRGKAARNWFERYYGTVDATPLYLILLSEVWRWTDDAALVRRFKEPALRALAWIDEYGDRDGDGFVEYERRSETGLANQSWKDSWDSQRYSRRVARGPADRAGRGPGLRLRREAPDGGARAGGLARPRARRAARPGGRRAARALRRGVLERRPRRLLRARARRRQEAGRLALLEHRPPALERDRPAGARSTRSSTA